MNYDIQTTYEKVTITCTCGNKIETYTARPDQTTITICSACHPFFTGQQKFVDTAGRVEKFMQKYAKQAPKADAKKAGKK